MSLLGAGLVVHGRRLGLLPVTGAGNGVCEGSGLMTNPVQVLWSAHGAKRGRALFCARGKNQ